MRRFRLVSRVGGPGAAWLVLIVTTVLFTSGSAAAATSNGWYGFIHTDATFDRTQWGGISQPNRLVQRDIATTVFRGDSEQLIFGSFNSEETNAIGFTCGMSGIYSDVWGGSLARSEGITPSSGASATSVPGGIPPQPGVAGNYRLRQGMYSQVPFTGTFTSFHTFNDTCTPVFFPVATSGNASIGGGTLILQDEDDNVTNIPAPAGWVTLSGSKTLQTVEETPGVNGTNQTVRTTTWTWSLTREPDLDYDGVPDAGDNCPPGKPGDADSFNPGQEDANGDGEGDACDVAKIVVVKQTTPDGVDQAFEFTGDLAGSVGDGGSISKEVEPGLYSTRELVPDGWDLESISCEDPTANSSGDETSRTASFSVGTGETVICTFTNTKRGQVKVVKTLDGRSPLGGESFGFELREGASTTMSGTVLEAGAANASNGGVIEFAKMLVPGTSYALCESVMPGWMTTLGPPFYVVYNPSGDNSVVCTDFTATAGATQTFTIENHPPPGGLGRTIGFWKNWASCTKSSRNKKPVLDATLAAAGQVGITIGTLTLRSSDCLKAVRLLDKSTIDTGKKMASDAAFNLAAQLLAARLNIVAGAGSCAAAVNALNGAQTLLAGVYFTGVTHNKLSATQTTQANTFATALDNYNNNRLC